MNAFRKLGPWLAVMGGAALLGAALLTAPVEAPAQQAARSAQPASGQPVGVGALGRIEPASRVRRLATAAGPEGARIARLLVTEGDQVAAGQRLAEFHDLPKKQAALAQATAERDMARLVAPIAGTVLRIMARPGEKVPDEGVLELADLSTLEVVAEVYETDLPRVREGAAAEVIVPGEARRFPARVTQVGWTVRRNAIAGTDPLSAIDARVVEVRLSLDPAAVPVLARRTNMQVQVAIAP